MAIQLGNYTKLVIVQLIIKAYIVKSFNIKLLLKSNSIGLYSIVLNYLYKNLIIENCNVVVLIGVTAKGHAVLV